jgi:hypothetical protein
LTSDGVELEPGGSHGPFDERLGVERARVDRQVAVLGGLGQRQRGAAGVRVDRLCADHDQRVSVLGEGLQGVEQRGPGADEQVSVASGAHWLPSNRVSRSCSSRSVTRRLPAAHGVDHRDVVVGCDRGFEAFDLR